MRQGTVETSPPVVKPCSEKTAAHTCAAVSALLGTAFQTDAVLCFFLATTRNCFCDKHERATTWVTDQQNCHLVTDLVVSICYPCL
jgi:hypothetical protein